jgi:hypothetical protein
MPPKRYTRKATNERYKGLQQLHKWLSRIDVEKDALQASPAIDRDHIQFFHKQADELFGGLLVTSYRQQNTNIPQTIASLQQSTEYFLDILKRYQVYKPQQFTALYNYADLPEKWRVMAPDVTEAIHDSGLSPHTFNPSISVLLNPGSYLDPGSRTRITDCNDVIGIDELLTKDIFNDMGISNINSLHTKIQRDGSLSIELKYNTSIISATFANTFVQTLGSPYFAGNATKNNWFNSANSTSNKNDAKLYILCKELGDTIQVYYAAKQNGFNMIRNKVCFFTNDSNAAYRCILLQAPACLSKPSLNSLKIFHYHPVMEDIARTWKKVQLDALLEHNDRIIREIDNVLNRGYYLQQNRRCITFNRTSAVAEFLRSCMKTIRDTTMQFKRQSSDGMSLATYSKLASGFKATRLFNQQVANRSVHSLFIKPTATSPLFPDYFGNFLYSQQSGGGITSEEEGDLEYGYNRRMALNNPTDYTTIDASIPDQHLPIMYVLNGIYTLLKGRYSEMSTAALRFMTEDIHSKLALYFSYAGVCLCSKPFLEAIVIAYETGVLQRMSHAEFLELYTPFEEEEDAKDPTSWEWKLLEAQVEKGNVEPYIKLMEVELEKPYEEPVEPRKLHSVKARTRKMRRV